MSSADNLFTIAGSVQEIAVPKKINRFDLLLRASECYGLGVEGLRGQPLEF